MPWSEWVQKECHSRYTFQSSIYPSEDDDSAVFYWWYSCLTAYDRYAIILDYMIGINLIPLVIESALNENIQRTYKAIHISLIKLCDKYIYEYQNTRPCFSF